MIITSSIMGAELLYLIYHGLLKIPSCYLLSYQIFMSSLYTSKYLLSNLTLHLTKFLEDSNRLMINLRKKIVVNNFGNVPI